MSIGIKVKSGVAVALMAITLCFPALGATQRRRVRVTRMLATAYAENAKPTAAGTAPHEGIVAADPAVLPLGTRIRVTGAGAFSRTYRVTDTGSKVVGRHIDLCLPTTAEAKQFGKKFVFVQILRTGTGSEDARAHDIPARVINR